MKHNFPVEQVGWGDDDVAASVEMQMIEENETARTARQTALTLGASAA